MVAGSRAQEHVFGHRQMGAHVELLVNDGDAQLLRSFGSKVADRFAPDKIFARITLINSGNNFHEGGLTGAVFPKQGVHFSRAQIKGHVVQRLDPREGFGHTGEPDRNRWPFPRLLAYQNETLVVSAQKRTIYLIWKGGICDLMFLLNSFLNNTIKSFAI